MRSGKDFEKSISKSLKIKIRGKVFGSLSPGTIDIYVGYGIGHLDGGHLSNFSIDEIPIICRMPNTYVWLTFIEQELVRVERMTTNEVKENLF